MRRPGLPGSGVVVAVDGSAASRAAVRIGAGFAARWGGFLSIVHVVGAPLVPRSHGPDPLPAAVEAAGAAEPGLDVRPLGRTGPVTAVLAELADEHALVVLGSRGHGTIRDATAGSHALTLAGIVRCPLVVVRPRADRLRPGGPVVAALAGGPTDAPVLDFAFAEATSRGVSLIATHGASRLRPAAQLVLAALAPGAGPAPEDEVLSELEPWTERYPEVRVRVDVRSGRAATSILEAARGAGLLVVGSRGHGPRTGLVLGSVSQAVLHHAHSPLAIVPFGQP